MTLAKEYLIQYPNRVSKMSECATLMEVERSTQVSGRLRWALGHQADAFVICRASRNASLPAADSGQKVRTAEWSDPLQNRLRSWTV
jgi:hypothetical protein